MDLRRLTLVAAAFGMTAIGTPASAMPIGMVGPTHLSQEAGVVPVYYRGYGYGYGPRAYYRPRRIYRSYAYDEAPVVVRRAYRYGSPYYGGYGYGGGYGGGYYGGGPGISFSFGGF